MDIYLIRHTSVDVPKGLCYGQSNVSLTKTFEEEAKVIQKKLPLTQVDFDLHLAH
jgi:alpha-ribazole phosphatase